jgi:hypothetical protein
MLKITAIEEILRIIFCLLAVIQSTHFSLSLIWIKYFAHLKQQRGTKYEFNKERGHLITLP